MAPLDALLPAAIWASRALSAGATATNTTTTLENHSDGLDVQWEAFINTFAMIIVSELGDKTFFIAALLAMQHSRRAVFLGAWGALVGMTILSASIGLVLPALLPRKYTHWAAVALFIYFGVKLLWEAIEMFRQGVGVGPSGELEEVEQSLKDGSPSSKMNGHRKGVALKVMAKALGLTFVAEWGDRSQIATIALAAAKESVCGVTLGGVTGHFCCTGLAVLGGRFLATSISERSVLMAGGALFLAFAAHGALYGVHQD
jgi:putative Ca2+/H+ antiporter (TMEM165/GDT1 family)